jgi:hypothetical protein
MEQTAVYIVQHHNSTKHAASQAGWYLLPEIKLPFLNPCTLWKDKLSCITNKIYGYGT